MLVSLWVIIAKRRSHSIRLRPQQVSEVKCPLITSPILKMNFLIKPLKAPDFALTPSPEV